MKQFKKILCGVMLTCFVILGSVSVFAAIPPNSGEASGGGGENDPPCVQLVVETATSESAQEYREEQTYLDTLTGEIGDSIPWDGTTPLPTQDPNDTDGDGDIDVIYKIITNYNSDWITEEYNCEIYIVGNTSYFT